MNDSQLGRLSTLVNLFEKCAKMGGTKPFERIQPVVTAELNKLLDDLQPPAKRTNLEPEAKPVVIEEIKEEESHVGRRV